MGGEHCSTVMAEQVVSRRWLVNTAILGGQSRECQEDGWWSLLYRYGRAGRFKEMGGDHVYKGRAEQGVSRRWVVTWLYRNGRAGSFKEMDGDHGYTRRAEEGVST